MKRHGVVQRTCAILADLMAGRTHDRQSIAEAHGVELAAADRYIRHLASMVPGVEEKRDGRKLTIRWWPEPQSGHFRVELSEQTTDLIGELAQRGIYGRTPEEVARRFIDEGIQRFCAKPAIEPNRSTRKKRG
jgi:hypothetical protein